MNESNYIAWFLVALHVAVQVLFIIRALLRTHREPSARMAWVLAIVTVPVGGIVAYILFGDTNIGRRRIARFRAALKRLPSFRDFGPSRNADDEMPERYLSLFKVGHSISLYPAVGGNQGALLADSDAAIDAMVADIDAATEHVHVLFYIWLVDDNGVKMIAALKRAAERGVTCRVMVDDIGSHTLIRSVHWRDMASAGVKLAAALPIGNILLRPLKGRIDMRNHRKIVVIDNRITYCGSQNCADPAFAVKARYAPWVDVMVRFTGPIVRQNQHLFASDWMGQVNEDLGGLRHTERKREPGFTAQVLGTGATTRYSAMPEMFVSLMNAATRELVITTPYYIPDEPIQAALCASAHRGVATTIIFPRHNDSWFVAAASRSYYRELLEAGVHIFEFPHGLLHAKTLVVDGEIGLIGSANVDRRSFELNFENNILFYDAALADDIRKRQQSYIEASWPVELDAVKQWSRPRRLLNNAMAMVGPLL